MDSTKNLMDKLQTDVPRIYVGTYKKYNEGDLSGKWVDLTEFDNEDDFYTYCYKLHDDEDDPQLMFQDFEYFPEEFYSECSISDDLWEWLELDDDQQEIVWAYIECFGNNSNTLESYEDAYHGYYDTFQDFVRELFDETNEIPSHLESYIDYEAVERDYRFDFSFHDGHVFSNH